jgi:hypothetical protein
MGAFERCNRMAVLGLLGRREEIEVERNCQDNGTELQVLRFDYVLFDSETQYKRQFGIWNLKRALSTTKKEKIMAALETRAQQGKLSVVRHQGKVEVQKVRRYMKEQSRRDMSIWTRISSEPVDLENLSGHALQCGNRV